MEAVASGVRSARQYVERLNVAERRLLRDLMTIKLMGACDPDVRLAAWVLHRLSVLTLDPADSE